MAREAAGHRGEARKVTGVGSNQAIGQSLQFGDFPGSHHLALERLAIGVESCQCCGGNCVARHRIENVVLLGNMSRQKRGEIPGMSDDTADLISVQWPTAMADLREFPNMGTPFGVLREHHRYRAVFPGKAATIHRNKQSIFLFAVMALIGKIAKETGETRNVLAWNCTAVFELPGEGVE